MKPSFFSPIGHNAHECGYCHSKDDTSHSFGMWAHQMNCADYQDLIDRGWRRSGKYVYKPEMFRTCCPQYTIRLDTQAFKPSKQHRQVINKLARYLRGEWNPLGSETPAQPSSTIDSSPSEAGAHDPGQEDHQECNDAGKPVPKREAMDVDLSKSSRPRHNRPFQLEIAFAEIFNGRHAAHNMRLVLQPARFTQEKFALYKKYQMAVHHDPPEKVKPKGFARFLVDSSLYWPGSYERPACSWLEAESPAPQYGSFHLHYYLDDRLVAISVLDLLPLCVSSVYFIYDPDYAFLSLGKVSALVEVQLAREERRRAYLVAHPEAAADSVNQEVLDEWSLPVMRHYYMGFYIHGCQKMEYKGQFQPSELLDPVQYEWVPLALANKLLSATTSGYSSFLPPVKTRVNTVEQDELRDVDSEEAAALMVFRDGQIEELGNDIYDDDNDEARKLMIQCSKRMASTTAGRIIFIL